MAFVSKIDTQGESGVVALRSMSAEALQRDADTQAIYFEGRWYHWGALHALAMRLDALLDGVLGERLAPIAFIPRNQPASVAALLGMLAGGRSIRMIYAFQSDEAIARNLAAISPAVVVAAAEDLGPHVRAFLQQEGIAALELQAGDVVPVPGQEQVRPGLLDAAADVPRIDILTSGTTGPPKQFSISYDMIARHLVGGNPALAAPEAELAARPPVLQFFPLGNISGIYATLPPLLKGMRLALLDRFSVEGWRDYVAAFKPASCGLPPAGIQMLLESDLTVEEISSIQAIGTGAAPLDPTIHKAFEDRFSIPVLLSYGATEYGGPVTAMTLADRQAHGVEIINSVGRPFGGAQIRVVDPETGYELPAGTQGLLEVISPRIGPDWIRSSDLAMIDVNGFLFHCGRADGAIMRGGFKILPETIERALLTYPAVAAVAVVGIADKRLGQAPVAVVQLRVGSAPVDAATLEGHLRGHLPATHVPVQWLFVEALPRTLSMKVDQQAVRTLIQNYNEGRG